MQGISIFKQIYAPRVSHVVTGFDGVSHPTHSPYALGEVVGNVGKMTAIVANDQADTWHVVNLKCGNLFDAVAVLGAFDESEAANMAMRCHGQYFDAVCGDVYESNTGGLQRFLSHPVYMRTNRPVYAEELAKLQDLASTQAILWDDVRLKSHNGSSKVLLLDMMRCDDDKALLEKMDFVEEESQLDGEIAEYDALVVEAYKLESTVSKLALAMDKATSISTLKVANQTLSKPKTMRGFGVIQQLVSFELSDGQAVSIIFNVSDSEANASAKMTKDDLLVAWKYKLNSRDITAAVQPNATQNVSLNMIASRIMGLADTNSEKFVAAQNKKSAMQAEFADSNERVKGLQGQEQALVQEIADLQKQLDEKAKNKALEAQNASQENFSNLFAEHDTIAKQYGYSVDNNGVIFTPKGKDTGVKIESPTGRLKISNAKDTLFTGVNPTGLAKFLESYWYAEKTKAGVVPPVDDAPVAAPTPASIVNDAMDKLLTKLRLPVGFEAKKDSDYQMMSFIPVSLMNTETGEKLVIKVLPSGVMDGYAATFHNENIKDSKALKAIDEYTGISQKTIDLLVEKLSELINHEFDLNPPVVEQPVTQPEQALVASSLEMLKKLSKNTEFDSWAIKHGVDEGVAKSILDTNINGNFLFELVTHDLPPNDELLKLQDGSILTYFRAKSEDVKSLSDEAFNLLLSQDDYNEKTGYFAYNILRNSNKKAELDYVSSLGAMNNRFRLDAQKYGGKLYKMAQPYLNNQTVEAQPQPVSEPPMTNPDKDYLRSIIDGKDTGLAPKEITAKMRTIITAAREAKDTETMALGDLAAKAYAAQTKAKAVAKLAEVQ